MGNLPITLCVLNRLWTLIAESRLLLTADVQEGQGMGVGLAPSQPLAIVDDPRKVKNYQCMLILKGHPFKEEKDSTCQWHLREISPLHTSLGTAGQVSYQGSPSCHRAVRMNSFCPWLNIGEDQSPPVLLCFLLPVLSVVL